MADVEIDYVAALGASEKLSSAGTVVSVGVAYIQGESTGVENPQDECHCALNCRAD